MPESNDAKTEFVLKVLDERIKREEEIIGINTESALKPRLDFCEELISSYDPAIKGIDAKIVSIGQSINIIKSEIITLISQAVGVGTTNNCALLNHSVCSLGGTTGWTGGISTCLVGFSSEYFDTVTSYNWGLSTTSDNPFDQTSTILSSSSNTFGVGVGTFLFTTQNNTSYFAGNRVSLGSSASCQVTATEITRKDAEIAALRTEIQPYIGVVNKIRDQRWRSQLEKWGSLRAITQAIEDRETLIGVKTAFSDSTYTSLFLK